MIVQPDRFIDEIVKAGADLVTSRGACVHLQKTWRKSARRAQRPGWR